MTDQSKPPELGAICEAEPDGVTGLYIMDWGERRPHGLVPARYEVSFIFEGEMWFDNADAALKCLREYTDAIELRARLRVLAKLIAWLRTGDEPMSQSIADDIERIAYKGAMERTKVENMSHVHNILVCCSVSDDELFQSKWNTHHSIEQFFQVDGHAGGCKAMEVAVFAAAFNYFAIDELLKFVEELDWCCPESVSVFSQDEHEDRMTQRWPRPKGEGE